MPTHTHITHCLVERLWNMTRTVWHTLKTIIIHSGWRSDTCHQITDMFRLPIWDGVLHWQARILRHGILCTASAVSSGKYLWVKCYDDMQLQRPLANAYEFFISCGISLQLYWTYMSFWHYSIAAYSAKRNQTCVRISVTPSLQFHTSHFIYWNICFIFRSLILIVSDQWSLIHTIQVR